MIKTLIGLVPLAIGVGLYGLAVWILLGRHMALGTWLFAAFLVGHGFVHVMFAMPRPEATTGAADGVDYPFDLSRSWLVNAGVDPALVRALALALVVTVAIAFVLAGLATVGLLIPSGWWSGLVVVASALSLALLVVGFNPGLAIGYVIDGLLIWVAIAALWSPGVPQSAS